MVKLESWLLFSILTFILWGIWGFFPKVASKYIDPKSFMVYEAIGVVIMAFVLLVLLHFKPAVHPKGIALGIATGIFAIAGTLFFVYALSRGNATTVVAITSLYPAITIGLIFFILKEPITLKQGVGIVFALIALFLFSV